MIFDTTQLIAALICALMIGMAKGGLAGGLGTLVVPILSLTMDPRVAAAIVLPVLMISDWFAVGPYWKKDHRGHLTVLLTGAVIGIAIGALTFHLVSEPMMRLLMGVLALIFVATRWLGVGRVSEEKLPPQWGPGIFWGALSGFTSFTAHAGSPPVQVYLLPKNVGKLAYQATTVMFFTIVNLVKLPPYLMLGQFSKPILLSSLAMMPAAAVGVFLGYKLQNKIPEKLFFRIMNLLLFLTGCKLTWDGVKALL